MPQVKDQGATETSAGFALSSMVEGSLIGGSR
jgi:hypothetical protein